MAHRLYTIFIRLMTVIIGLVAPFHTKAGLWVEGRKNWRTRFQALRAAKPGARLLWVHAASLGEFEQGRPVIEAFREEHPDWLVLLSFFSPSGYEIRQQYPHADFVVYLPADTPENARDFLEIFQPDLAVFVKYEFWANYLFALQRRRTPTLLVSAIFRPQQPFFRWYGGFWRSMLPCYAHLFVQNTESENLLKSIGIQHITVAGDTRIDRVLAIAAQAAGNPVAQAFTGGAPTLVMGSSWEPDENLLFPVLFSKNKPLCKLIVAPHDPAQAPACAKRLLQANETLKVVFYSTTTPEAAAAAEVLVIDNIGLLNTLYRYGSFAWIGGGFGKGIHNTLEPAAWGLPVLFGPHYKKFEEARQLIACGGAFAIREAPEAENRVIGLLDSVLREKASAAARGWLDANKGATQRVMDFLAQQIKNRL